MGPGMTSHLAPDLRHNLKAVLLGRKPFRIMSFCAVLLINPLKNLEMLLELNTRLSSIRRPGAQHQMNWIEISLFLCP
jgi:hypothetical protein